MSSAATGQPEVTRLVCASVSRVRGSVMGELFAIRERIGRGTAPTAVRSALLYASGWFVLWLEGPAEAVEAVRARCERDERNHHQKVLHRSHGPAQLEEDFSLVSVQLRESPSVFSRRVRIAMEEGACADDPAPIWQQLCAPCTVPPQGDALPSPARRVALLSADDNGPIDTLRAIGERHAGVVTYQRFVNASPQSTDVGVAYVDIAVGQEVRRILLLSRRALGYELVRRSLAGLDAFVLLLGARPESALELALGVRDCLQAVGQQPSLRLVAPSPAAAQPVAALLDGGTWLDADSVTRFLLEGGRTHDAPPSAFTGGHPAMEITC